MTTIAKIGNKSFDTIADAAGAIAKDQILFVTRSGQGSEATGTLNGVTAAIIGVRDAAGALPKLILDRYTRPAWGKAIINLEEGNYEVANLHLEGCAVPESNGAGLRINDKTGVVKAHHLRVVNNENGIISAENPNAEIYLSDIVFDKNGQASDNNRRGYSHNAYLGKIKKFQADRVSFTNSAYGHDLKSRALTTVLNEVLCEGSANGRALDLSNGGVLKATNVKFSKNASSGQNNLIDIGAEGFDDGRPEEYILTNCQFHNDVDPGRDVQYILNRSKKEIVLVDPLFTGAASKKDRKSTLVGNIRVVLTGGPLGPLKEVGGNPDATWTAPLPSNDTSTPAPSNPSTPTASFSILGAAPNVDGTWAKIAKEDETVTVAANTTVRYGANGKYIYALASGAVKADNKTFVTDPAPQVVKVMEAFTPTVKTPAPSDPSPTNPSTVTLDAASLGNVLSALFGKTITVTIK